MVSVWTGREANALREAMRCSIDDFAARTGMSRRTVATWSARGNGMRLRWDAQRILDRLLATAGDEVHQRLESLLEPPPAEPGGPAPELIAALVNPPEPDADSPAPALIHLERAVAQIRMGFQACRIRETTDRLPELMRLLLRARSVRDTARVGKLAAEAYHVAVELLLELGDVPLSMFAAQRCAEEARASGQPLTIAASERATASVLMRSGHAGSAATLTQKAAQRLSQSTTLDGPRPLSGYGALLLTGASAHARLGERAQAVARLDDATRIAERLGDDGNFGWTAFGPTNVALHRLSALLALGDPAGGLKAVKHLDPARIHPVERQAAYYRDTAEALHRMGKPHEAAAATARAAKLIS